MTRGGLVALAALAVGLAAVVGLELRPGIEDQGGMSPAAPRTAPRSPTAAAAPGPADYAQDHAADWVRTVLARPLFAPGRRAAAAAVPGAATVRLPRVTGILVDGSRRSVIFASVDGGKPLVVAEGAEISGFRVQSIDTGQVTVVGPDGPSVLRPSFDPTPRQAAPVQQQAVPQGLNFQGLNPPGLPGFGPRPGASAR